MFSDDAFNQSMGDSTGQGTLIGNWFEERALREAVGEGRSVPQRHMPRSGLLQDFSKSPQSGPRKTDNTFERCVGHKVNHSVHEPSSRVIGQHDRETVNHQGPRVQTLRQEWRAVAEAEVQQEDDVTELRNHERSFNTTHGVSYVKPDDALVERAAYLKKSCHKEIRHGPPPDRSLALENEGLDFDSHTHYANVEGITANRTALADPVSKNNLKLTAPGGVRTFGRNSEFSKPVTESTRGLAKDEELVSMYEGLKGTQPLRNISGGEPRAGGFATVPSLATVKGVIHSKIGAVWGSHGYVVLRQRLFDRGDNEGFITKAEVVEVLRVELGLTDADLPGDMLDVYLSQQITMKKTEMKIGSFLSSLRPVLPPRERRRVLDAFKAMAKDDTLRLGDWLSRLGDRELHSTLVAAFGAQEEELVADMPLSEQVFLEVLSDLAPFMDIAPLVA